MIGAFLTGLREQVLVGIKGSDGRVLVPPTEYDPTTGEDLTELVEVGPGGEVHDLGLGAASRIPKHPLDHPFAWALVQPDGADTACSTSVDAGSIDAMPTGMRVVPRWADEREGHINDLACWVPEDDGASDGDGRESPCPRRSTTSSRCAASARRPARLHVHARAGHVPLPARASPRGRSSASGARCGKVYVPPRGACPTDGVPTTEQVELAHTGTRHVVLRRERAVLRPGHGDPVHRRPHPARRRRPADHAPHPGGPADEVRIGMRVEAVWVPTTSWAPTLESIK